jgi:hypothetical protein
MFVYIPRFAGATTSRLRARNPSLAVLFGLDPCCDFRIAVRVDQADIVVVLQLKTLRRWNTTVPFRRWFFCFKWPTFILRVRRTKNVVQDLVSAVVGSRAPGLPPSAGGRRPGAVAA